MEDEKYLFFDAKIDDKQYNTDAMNCLEWILGLHIGDGLGTLTWEQVCKRYPAKMGLIIRDAKNSPELEVFAQAAGQWAIQMLITNKINSRIRYNRDHQETEANIESSHGLAPMTVPDIEEETHGPDQYVEDEWYSQEFEEENSYVPAASIPSVVRLNSHQAPTSGSFGT